MSTLITIDNGGTLTDVCVIDGESVSYTKTLTTPHDLSRCLFDGLERVAAERPGGAGLTGLLQSADYIRYSTTQGTNALVQRKGPKLGLIVDDPALLAELAGDEQNAELYRTIVGTRCAAIDLTKDDAELSADLVRLCNQLAGDGASRLVISISGLHGAESERRVRTLLLAIFPRHLLGAVPLLFSNELVGADHDDARRTWSSLLNAFLHPAMERFLFNSERRLRAYRTRNPLLVFRNDGASSRVAKSAAIKTYSSGPRGGVEGTRALALHYGLADVVMVDVGGTTTDVAVVRDGVVEIDRHGSIAGVETSLPLARITSHGIGGSSVFHVVDGVLTVGPDSVGAAPGPACFGLGGTEATLTDVLLLTGVLDSRTYLGGSMRLDAERSAAAVQATVADPLGVDLPIALALMQDAFAERLADALRPLAGTDTTVAAFGGAGPMSICPAARRAGIKRVLIPRTAAVFSAFGIGFSDIGHTYSAAVSAHIDAVSAQETALDLEAKAARDMFAEGIALADCTLTWHFVAEDGTATPLAGPADAPGHGAGRLQLDVVAVLPHPHFPAAAAAGGQLVVSTANRAVQDAVLPVVDLLDQPTGATGAGPAVVEGPFFTMQLPAGWQLQITPSGDLLLTDATTEERS